MLVQFLLPALMTEPNRLNLKSERESHDAVSGFLLDEIGYISEENGLQPLEFWELRVEIQKIQDKRIQQILVTEILEPAGNRSEDSH